MTRTRPARTGLTLVEMLITMAVMAVLVAIAVPSMYQFIMRKRVQGVADELLGDVRFTRSIQTRDNRDTTIKFGSSSAGSCYVVFQPNSVVECDCTQTPVCAASIFGSAIEFKTVRLPASNLVTVSPATASPGALMFKAVTGLPGSSATLNVRITAPSGGEVRLTTSAAGRPQLCSVSGHGSAYPACATSP